MVVTAGDVAADMAGKIARGQGLILVHARAERLQSLCGSANLIVQA